jgi:lysophospholipase L1-like esterase
MEERTLLSLPAGPVRVATLGDSLTDEYQFYAPDRTAAENWTEILATARGSQVTLGDFTTATRGETRNQGDAQNWARSGATAQGPDVAGANTTFVEQYQGGFAPGLPGLLTQPGGVSNVDVVNILIGGNDYMRALENAAMNPTPSNFFTQFLTANAGIIGAIETVVPLLEAANPNLHVIIDATPNIDFTPVLENAIAFLPPADQTQITTALASFADSLGMQLQQFAQSTPNTGFIDVDDLFRNFSQNPVIGGVFVNPDVGGPLATDLFVGDGFHPGTVAQGLLANAIIGQIDKFFPGAVTPLSDQEILSIAQSAQPVTSATLTASAGSTAAGQPVTFHVQVATFPPINTTTGQSTFPTPTGTVSFFDAANGNQLLGTATLDTHGSASLTTSSLATGIHNITAAYSGDPVYPPAVPRSVQVLVGTPKQVQLFSFIVTLQQNLGLQVSPPQLAHWTRLLDRGVPPQHVARMILQRVSRQTQFPRNTAASTSAAQVHPASGTVLIPRGRVRVGLGPALEPIRRAGRPR